MRNIYLTIVLVGMLIMAATMACGEATPESKAIDLAEDWANHEGKGNLDVAKKGRESRIKYEKEKGRKAKKGEGPAYEFSIAGNDIQDMMYFYYDGGSNPGSDKLVLPDLLKQAESRVEYLSTRYGESSEFDSDSLYMVFARLNCSTIVEFDRGRETFLDCGRAFYQPRSYVLAIDIERNEVLASLAVRTDELPQE